MKLEHNGCNGYRRCARCRQIQDRWELIPIIFGILVVFTVVIPVIPLIFVIIF